MKKIIIAAAAVLCMATATQAQNTFDKGSMVGTLGLGFGDSYGLPISGALDWSVINLWDDKSHLGVGALAGIALGDYTYALVGGRVSLHYQFIDKLDTYFGLGYNLYFLHDTFGDWDAYIGARYYFWDRLGLFLELGAQWANCTLGVSYKF